jgi:hypothetical protein
VSQAVKEDTQRASKEMAIDIGSAIHSQLYSPHLERPGSIARSGILFAHVQARHTQLASIVLKKFFVSSRPLQVKFFSGGGVD